jgi:hypothetical protein
LGGQQSALLNVNNIKVLPKNTYNTTVGTGPTNGNLIISWNRQ